MTFQYLKTGWCKKEGHIVKNIKNRFFRLEFDKLSYYTEESGKFKGDIPIFEETKFVDSVSEDGEPMIIIEGKRNVKYKLFPPSFDERNDWIAVLRNTVKFCGGCRNQHVRDNFLKIFQNYIRPTEFLFRANEEMFIFTSNLFANKIKDEVYTVQEFFGILSHFAELNPTHLKYYIKMASTIIKNLSLTDSLEALGMSQTFVKLFEQYKDDLNENRMIFYPAGDIRNALVKDDLDYFKICPQADNPTKYKAGELSLLAAAALYGATSIFKFLQKKCEVDQQVIMMAYAGGDEKIIQVIRKEFNKMNADIVTAMAVHSRNLELYTYTTQKDATSFPWVPVLKNYNMFSFFNKLFGAISLNATDIEGNTALHAVAATGIISIVKMLIEFEVQIDVVGKDKKTPFYLAIENDKLEAAELLLNAGANIESPDNSGTTPLIQAAMNGSKKAVEFLVLKSANINAINANNCSALGEAVRHNNIEIATFLLEHGAKDEGAKVDGMDILQYTIAKGFQTISCVLILYGARIDNININISLVNGTPLVLAIKYKNVPLLKNVINYYPDIGLKFEDKYPIEYAVEGGSLDVVRTLIENGGADIHTRDPNGNTLLMIAAKYDYIDIFEYLIRQGAEVVTKNKSGQNVQKVAQEANAEKVLKYMKTEQFADNEKMNFNPSKETNVTSLCSSGPSSSDFRTIPTNDEEEPEAHPILNVPPPQQAANLPESTEEDSGSGVSV